MENVIMTKEKFNAAIKVLIDNGIEIDEAQTVLQTLSYVILDEETEHLMSDDIKCCQNCMTSECTDPVNCKCFATYSIWKDCEGWIHN